MFLETVWDTGIFPESEWPSDGSQPFVWAQGDPTGYGHHADYLFGWKGDSLQRATDARCDFSGCTELKTQSFATESQCIQEQIAKDSLDGCKCCLNSTARNDINADRASGLETLPGNRTITYA